VTGVGGPEVLPAAGGAVLLLTGRLDVHADLVVEELGRRGVPVLRVDPGDFPARMSVTATFDGRWRTVLRTAGEQGRTLDLDALRGAYYRRPSPFRLPPGLSEEERRWAGLEARVGLGGLLAAVRCWLNHPARIGAAEYKPVQLAAAASAGLATPRTLVTNDPAAAAAFARDLATGGVVYKPFSSVTEVGGARAFVHTTAVTSEQVADEGVRSTAHLFQERVDKACEVRLTVVDDRLLAARLTARSAGAQVDWRAAPDAVDYGTVEVPPEVAAGVVRMLAALELRFAAMDFAVDRDGRWLFLDLNPNGQWAWIEQETGLPICAAVCDALTAQVP